MWSQGREGGCRWQSMFVNLVSSYSLARGVV